MHCIHVCSYHILVITTQSLWKLITFINFINLINLITQLPFLLAHLDDAAPKAFGFLLHGFALPGLNPLVELVLEEVDGTALLAERDLALAGVAVESVFRLAGDLACAIDIYENVRATAAAPGVVAVHDGFLDQPNLAEYFGQCLRHLLEGDVCVCVHNFFKFKSGRKGKTYY